MRAGRNKIKQYIHHSFISWMQESMFPNKNQRGENDLYQASLKKTALTAESSSKYYTLFNIPHLSNQTLLVDKTMWDQIMNALPKDYKIPHPNSQKLFDSFNAKVYESLFKYPTANILVNNEVWDHIANSLPPDYKLP